MSRFALGLMSMLISSAMAAPELAVVRVAEIYRLLPNAREISTRTAQAKTALKDDSRVGALKQSLKELEGLQVQLSAAQDLDRLTRERLQQQFAVKRDEVASLRREMELFQSAQLKKINAQMVAEMESVLERIRTTAAETARDGDYELLIDLTGKTNSTVPFIVYAKQPVDITDEVLTRLGVSPEAVRPDSEQ